MHVVYIIATGDLKKKLNLHQTYEALGGAIFEPTQNPNVIYHDRELSMSFMITSSGKVIMTGAPSEKIIREGITQLLIRLSPINE